MRKQGFSLNELARETKISRSTLSLLVRKVKLSDGAKKILNTKKFKSKEDSFREWSDSKIWAKKEIGKLSKRDLLIVLGMIYWGEGTKSELNIINSDPEMIRVFMYCLRKLKISEDDIQVGLRLFSSCDKKTSILFWSGILKISEDRIKSFEYVMGSKKHKHIFGMCRVRIRKGGLYFKKIMSIIEYVKQAAVV